MTTLTEKFSRLLPVLLLAAFLAGCASSGDKDKIPESWSEAEIYQSANRALNDKRFSDAIKSLRTLESRYPFGSFAEQAQLDLIFAYFRNGEPEAAKAAADRFIRLHPQHQDTDYAYYMKGLASNTAALGFLERYLPLDMTHRDPGQARVSFNEFAELLSRFPDSKYAPDARQRMIELRNRLAQYELHAANYYMKRKAYVAAVNRGRYVVENMQQTPSVAEALSIMVEGYHHLGLMEPADEALETLRLNFPNHKSLDKKGNFVGYQVFDDVDPSILSTLTFGLFGNSKSKPKPPKPPKPPEVPEPPAKADAE